ncbi:hypothetical protein [Curtobacterium sp. ISL-83]|uniref:hypothetical protein n=1 Tax=Curtobacterium sp. ISL-83 TaxID=2819145 RepID=UPI001BE5A793|nr:hypothetical protein [Curtobacterium sp. ISL-83]MBT2501103.1 hypothetical protein [Curtobacterium sp. ISL-83]
MDDLTVAFTRSNGACPAGPGTTFWNREGAPGLIVTTGAGKVTGIAVGNYEPGATTANSPTTAAGAGLGSSLTELRTDYPELAYVGTYGVARGQYSIWSTQLADGRVEFQLGEDGVHVGMIWVSAAPLPYEFCG